MPFSEITVEQINSAALQVENLPDGSTAVFNTATQTIHSLHPIASAAFTACPTKKTLSELVVAMSDLLSRPVTEAEALSAISELEHAGLVACAEPPQFVEAASSRRSLLKAAGAAVPLVLSLTALEQSAYAEAAGSGTTTTTTTTLALE
jgi:hypothetical protein